MNISAGEKGRKEKTLFKVSGKQKQLVSKKRNSLLGGDTSPKLLRCDFFKIVLNQQIRGWVSKKEGSVPISLTTNVGEDRAQLANVRISSIVGQT